MAVSVLKAYIPSDKDFIMMTDGIRICRICSKLSKTVHNEFINIS